MTVDSIDDTEEMQIMDEAFDILGFKWYVQLECKFQLQNISQLRDEKIDVYRVTSCCMVLSQLEFQVLMLPLHRIHAK